ncbi:methylation site containing protein [Shewanella halifaxensis HAW-EB4]|uniref:Methylation site containing protein n=1 Tax=Shewanella halifaxensis (strain HAW-EB4) TaxID=458817 RepID=B0TSI3_SHEHH|nr:prepilin-type N-terminal cleavage/methylation domain-containing protein [Shewanella halifaxensis]ABZ77937.1 methylation site containing protein [Shewanella halifaxensis HAW-EB4]
MTRNTVSSGFTLIEMVVVIIVLAILAIIAASKFINLGQDAEIASVQATGGAFKGGITLANVKWVSLGASGPADNLQVFHNDSNGQLDINLWGFPAQSYPPFESSPRLNNSNDCMSVWRTVLQDAPQVSNSANTPDAEYLATYIVPDQCRYLYLPEQTMSIYYDSRDGNVITDSDPNS